MSVLRAIESKIEGLVEGVFGRAFRTHVQPVELARKLAKEMDEHRSVSVSRVYVPNEYTLYLAPGDREQFLSYEGSLLGELQEYLAEHARREGYSLLSSPRVLITSDDDLAIGEFGIATRVVQPAGADGAPPDPVLPAPPEPSLENALAVSLPAGEEAAAVPRRGARCNGHLPADRTGRARPRARARASASGARDGDAHDRQTVSIPSPSVASFSGARANVTSGSQTRTRRAVTARSCRTALRRGVVVDLGSTNGTELNGHQVQRAALTDGDRVTIGGTDVVFGRSLQ